MKNLANEREIYNSVKMSPLQVDQMIEKIELAKKENKRMNKNHRVKNIVTAVAAAVAIVILLPNTSPTVANAMSEIPVLGKLCEVVTFRNYHYEDEKHYADVKIPEIVDTTNGKNEVLQESVGEINQDIQDKVESIVADFQNTTLQELGVKDVIVNSEVITSNERYFTLKINCYEAEASGYEWNYYYTIDLLTGKRMALKDMFPAEYDYVSEISDSILTQMEQRMSQDENISYWLHEEELGEDNFSKIKEDASFFVNEEGKIVIVFDEGEVAPAYMGVQYFTIDISHK